MRRLLSYAFLATALLLSFMVKSCEGSKYFVGEKADEWLLILAIILVVLSVIAILMLGFVLCGYYGRRSRPFRSFEDNHEERVNELHNVSSYDSFKQRRDKKNSFNSQANENEATAVVYRNSEVVSETISQAELDGLSDKTKSSLREMNNDALAITNESCNTKMGYDEGSETNSRDESQFPKPKAKSAVFSMSSDPENETRKHFMEKDIQDFGSQGFKAKDTLIALKEGCATTTAATNAGSSKGNPPNQAKVLVLNENLEKGLAMGYEDEPRANATKQSCIEKDGPQTKSKDVSSKAGNHFFLLTNDNYNTKTEQNKSKEWGKYEQEQSLSPQTERAIVSPSSLDQDTRTNSTYSYKPSDKQGKIQNFNDEEFTPENTWCCLEGPETSTLEPKAKLSEGGGYLSPLNKRTKAKRQQIEQGDEDVNSRANVYKQSAIKEDESRDQSSFVPFQSGNIKMDHNRNEAVEKEREHRFTSPQIGSASCVPSSSSDPETKTKGHSSICYTPSTVQQKIRDFNNRRAGLKDTSFELKEESLTITADTSAGSGKGDCSSPGNKLKVSHNKSPKTEHLDTNPKKRETLKKQPCIEETHPQEWRETQLGNHPPNPNFFSKCAYDHYDAQPRDKMKLDEAGEDYADVAF